MLIFILNINQAIIYGFYVLCIYSRIFNCRQKVTYSLFILNKASMAIWKGWHLSFLPTLAKLYPSHWLGASNMTWRKPGPTSFSTVALAPRGNLSGCTFSSPESRESKPAEVGPSQLHLSMSWRRCWCYLKCEHHCPEVILHLSEWSEREAAAVWLQGNRSSLLPPGEASFFLQVRGFPNLAACCPLLPPELWTVGQSLGKVG